MSLNSNDESTQRYDRQTSEKRKLEKQLALAKANQFSLSAHPNNWEVKEDKALGTYFVLMLGNSKSGNVQHLIVHRPIGMDYRLDKANDWCLSKSTDIPGYLASQEYPGKAKVVKVLSELKAKTAIDAGLLQGVPGDEKYPNGTSRKEILDQARAASDAHAKVKGGHHFGEWFSYLPPQFAKVEVKIETEVLSGNADFRLESAKILMDMAIFQTSLVDGTKQQRVPYLYGVSEDNVLRTMYQALIGGEPTKGEIPDFQSGILLRKRYTGFKPGDEAMRMELVRLLETHSRSYKEFNMAKADHDRAKSKETKKEAKTLLDSKEHDLKDITSRILAVEDPKKYPKVDYVTAYELKANPKLSPPDFHKALAEYGGAPVTS
jgi:hypothetical protein